jgi:hypothetical protein
MHIAQVLDVSEAAIRCHLRRDRQPNGRQESPHYFPPSARQLSNFVGTTDKVHPPYRSKEEAGVSLEDAAGSAVLHNPVRESPGPALAAGFKGATSSENSVFQSMLTRLIDQALVDNRELTMLVPDIKDDADEPLSEIFEQACESACASDRLQHAASSAVLCNPPSASGGAATAPAGNLQRSGQPGKLSSARDRRVFQ